MEVAPSSFDTELYISECLARSDAPIKPAYVKDKERYPPYRAALGLTALGPTSAEAAPGLTPAEAFLEEEQKDDGEGDNSSSPKPLRGQNKKRKLNTACATQFKIQAICPALAAVGTCTRGPECKRNHDLSARMAELSQLEPAESTGTVTDELGSSCPIYTQRGICPNGVNCTFNPLAHVDAAGVNMTRCGRPVIEADIKSLKQEERNHPSDVISISKSLKLHQRPAKLPKNKLLEDENCALASNVHIPTDAEKREDLQKKLRGKLILAPLTTVGNLPFRRLCLKQGCEATVSEMVLASSLCQLKTNDLALVKRHSDEKLFGVQIAGGFPDQMKRAAEIIEASIDCDWVDINMGCPLTGVHDKGAGCALMQRETKLMEILQHMSSVLTKPLSVKCRTGFVDKTENVIHNLLPRMQSWGASGFTLHGRTAKQRYLKDANWSYIKECRNLVGPDTLFVGNGDLFDTTQIIQHWQESQVDALMIGRGALIKPWIFSEIKSGQPMDISANERFDILKDFCKFGLEHWGCDSRGLETTRKFLLEQLSFLHRYVPVGLMERHSQRMNWRPPLFVGRNDLETLMARSDVGAWIKLSEMILGKVPEEFVFLPKHRSNAFEVATNVIQT